MRLRQLKLRGLGEIPESGWLQISPRLTLFSLSSGGSARALLRAVQTLNPPWDCHQIKPFSAVPLQTVTRAGHRKIVRPEKRTVVLGVFDSSAALVRELGGIDRQLYETDRIEIGRRLDYSRWINFVEIAGSSRWSEISTEVTRLSDLDACTPEDARLRHLLREAAPTDRIRGEAAQLLADWLRSLEAKVPDPAVIGGLLDTVLRAERFTRARQLIERRLPRFLALRPDPGTTSAPLVEPLVTIGDNGQAPIVLLDLVDRSPVAEPDEGVAATLEELGRRCQCLAFVCGGWTRNHLPGIKFIEDQDLRAP